MRWVLVAVCCFLAATLAFAQGTPNSFELTPLVGYWFGDHISTASFDYAYDDMRTGDATVYGLRAAYRFTPNWAVEGYLSQARPDLFAGYGGMHGEAMKVGTLDTTTAEVNMEVAFGHSRFVPFLGFGVGAMRLDPHYTVGGVSGGYAQTEFVGDFGVGFKIFFNPNVALRFDWRGHSVDFNHYDSCDWDYGGCYYGYDWVTFTELSLGVTFVF
jgi:Outer membrane protein beta-barrel domain